MAQLDFDTGSTARRAASAAADQAGSVGRDTSARVRTLAGTARQEVAALGDETSRRVQSLWGDLQGEIRREGNVQSARLGEALQSWVDEVTALSEGRAQDAPRLVPYLDRAVDSLDGLARSFAQGGIEGQLDQVRRFARRKPGLFLLGAAVAGLGVGRIVRGQHDARPGGSAGGGEDTELPWPVAAPAASADFDDGWDERFSPGAKSLPGPAATRDPAQPVTAGRARPIGHDTEILPTLPADRAIGRS